MELEEFALNLQQDVYQDADLEGEESLRHEAFTKRMIEELTEAGEIDDGIACYHRARGLEVSGYSFSEDGESLDLFVTLYTDTVPPSRVGKADIEGAFRRLTSFLSRSLEDYCLMLEEASPVFDMALRIREGRRQISRLRVFLLTDAVSTFDPPPDGEIDGYPVTFHLWDIERLFRCVSSGLRHESIEIDFVGEFGEPLPCLMAPDLDPEFDSYLAIIPGKVLYSIYARFGARLLELNVRSFLQARGKVNRGIRKTILEEPDRFLAYNNGITATASFAEIVAMADGGLGIGSVKDFQIVNGGQTTASIYQAVRTDRADIAAVYVQTKLTVVGRDEVKRLVPLISRYANSQNKINEADFSANDPFHVRLEELSRTVWAPANDGTQKQTRWFYERARGQYQDAVGREGTPARKRQFKLVHPPAQKFTKTDLAKFENTWSQLPHLVSQGAEKNFREYTIRKADGQKVEPDQQYFERLVAKAILFRRAEKIVAALRLGGYRANIVTYSLAYIANRTAATVDLDRIWRSQGISDSLSDAIEAVALGVHSVITNPPGGKNVTEWCKRLDCWERVRKLEITLSAELKSDLLSPGAAPAKPDDELLSDTDRSLLGSIAAVEADFWFALSAWAKETSNLEPWQRGLAFSLGRLAGRGKEPSVKQAKQGARILEEAARLGFLHVRD